MKADVDRLTALDEVNDIELQTSRYKVQQLLDSVGKLTFTIERLRELQLAEKFEASQNEIQKIQSTNAALAKAEALKRDKIQDLNKELKTKIIIASDDALANQERVIYLQFLGPNMGIIEDNANTINVNGNVYSKRVAVNFTGEQTQVVDYISIPEGSLESGDYILNVFEDQRLLQTTEFQLK